MRYLLLALLFIASGSTFAQSSWIRINQAGYLPKTPKVAVFISTDSVILSSFTVNDARTGKVVFSGKPAAKNGAIWGMKSAYRLPFTQLDAVGSYYVMANGVRSLSFTIANDVYKGAADYVLTYMRQQRCGYNPYLDTLCHQHDGYIVDHPTRTGEFIDAKGGWHDAADYLQYVTTSANAIYQMLFAYSKNPSVFKDEFNSMGKRGGNGIPDILDEAKWGLEWLVRMNPEPNVMFNQIADDRDHANFRSPSRDKVDYGWGPGTGRPVYFVTGKPQGLRANKNRSTGVASTAGKFASAFALGAKIFKGIDDDFANLLSTKSVDAFSFGEAFPGVCQTACTVSPYFYEEGNYVDDMELAAASLYLLKKDSSYLGKAASFGVQEPVTPWMETGKARHYEWYPFVNLGHYHLANSADRGVSSTYKEYMRKGLEDIRSRAADDPFMNGVPFLWCSNNFVFGALTQARLYNEVSGDNQFDEMEAALRDWIFGCNPWGTSMIVGFPFGADTPLFPHSAYTKDMGDPTWGGLVDGPVYQNIFKNLRGLTLYKSDPYASFQGGRAVYHDDIGDYSSNEPTMDGTASTTFYLSALEALGRASLSAGSDVKDGFGAVVRRDTSVRKVYLVFTADSLFEGIGHIRKVLKDNRVKASFFVTGSCVRLHEREVRLLVKDGYYVGPHSDRHLLYCSWDRRSQTLVAPDSLDTDIANNLKELKKVGVDLGKVRWFIPPYEYYNKDVVARSKAAGLDVISFTPKTYTNADYTIPSMKNYRSSQQILDALWTAEKSNSNGLNGAILLVHPGTHPDRVDKLYLRLDELVKELKKRGYEIAGLL
jgi:peptidoglycan/xylan/chitin deacetylase (PgdA/CDA1 family)